ncbi:MAG: SagB/ThcOx family dehydrogenase [Thermoanaerobaculaceae bacterium]|jgi:SagB-type dehydrogenase family enzyme
MKYTDLCGRAAAVAFIAVAAFGAAASGQEQAPPGRRSRSGFVPPTPRAPTGPTVKLQAPKAKGAISVEQALWGRRSLRSATQGQITLEDVGQLVWAAQGVTGEWGRRAAPSAGALYPLEVLLVAGDVAGLPAGLYRYYGVQHVLERIADGDKRPELAQISKFQGIDRAPAIIVITGVEARTAKFFPNETVARQHIAMEAGSASQNLELEAVALGLGTGVVADWDEQKLLQALHTPPGEAPFVVLVVSRQ